MLDHPNEDGIYPTTKFYYGIDLHFQKLLEEYATWRLSQLPPHEDRACPCLYLDEPCHPRCTCTIGCSSTGCFYCCTYGSLEQRKSAAERIAKAIKASQLPPVSQTDADLQRLVSMVCDQYEGGFAGREEFCKKTVDYWKQSLQPVSQSAGVKTMKPIVEVKAEADEHAKRVIALGWHKNRLQEVISGAWEAGYVMGSIDSDESPVSQPQQGAEILIESAGEACMLIIGAYEGYQWEHTRSLLYTARQMFEYAKAGYEKSKQQPQQGNVYEGLLSVLEGCRDYFEDRAEADFKDEHFQPNKEMTILSLIDAVIKKTQPQLPTEGASPLPDEWGSKSFNEVWPHIWDLCQAAGMKSSKGSGLGNVISFLTKQEVEPTSPPISGT
jgi:hypothetical protein